MARRCAASATTLPAFMLIRRRGPLKAILDEPVEEDIVTVDPDDGTDMAA